MTGAALALLAALQTVNGWDAATGPASLQDIEVRSVLAAQDGSVWFGVRDRGLARLVGEELHWISEREGLGAMHVADLLIDSTGHLWASGRSGYSVLREGQWHMSSRVGGSTPRVVYSLSEDPRTSAIWMGTTLGAGRLLDGEWTMFGPAVGLPHAVVHAAHADANGDVWFACRAGLARLRNDRMDVMFPDINFRSILEDPAGGLWFGSSDGALFWDGESWTHDLRGRVIYPRLVSGDRSVWAGSASSGVLRYAGGAWTSIELPEAFAGAEVFDLAEGTDGSIWVASSVGVARLRPVGDDAPGR